MIDPFMKHAHTEMLIIIENIAGKLCRSILSIWKIVILHLVHEESSDKAELYHRPILLKGKRQDRNTKRLSTTVLVVENFFSCFVFLPPPLVHLDFQTFIVSRN